MAISRLVYNPNTWLGTMTKNSVASVLVLRENVARIKANLDSMVGFPADYTQIEQYFSMPAGQGQAFYNNVASLAATLSGIGNYIYDLDQGL